MTIPIFALGRIYCGMYVAEICSACIIDLLGVVGVLHTMYLVSAKATVIILGTKMHPTNFKGRRRIFI